MVITSEVYKQVGLLCVGLLDIMSNESLFLIQYTKAIWQPLKILQNLPFEVIKSDKHDIIRLEDFPKVEKSSWLLQDPGTGDSFCTSDFPPYKSQWTSCYCINLWFAL